MREPARRRKEDGQAGRVRTVAGTARGLTVARYFTTPGVEPFDAVEWERRSAVITGERGEVGTFAGTMVPLVLSATDSGQ